MSELATEIIRFPCNKGSFERPTSAQTITGTGTELDHGVELQPSPQHVMMHRRDIDYYD